MLGLEPSPTTGRRGSIINFASLLTFQGGLTVPAYAASKGAVGQLTKSFANEWTARGVTVNAIAPGYIETEMNTALLNDPARLESISARIPAGRVGHTFLLLLLLPLSIPCLVQQSQHGNHITRIANENENQNTVGKPRGL
jgi:NAD(P)-dependent dehydrogenase (short-subunit alcohol dehydrogenase family)